MDPSPLPASLGPVLEFMRSLWALDHALSEGSRHVRSRFGITATQRLVVRIVGQTPGTSAGDVARVLHVHPSTLTPVLQQLVERRLLRRDADPLDRRRALLWLTSRGERLDAASAAAVDDRVRRALARVAPSQVFHARQVLSAITEALEVTPSARAAPRDRRGDAATPVVRLHQRRARGGERASPERARSRRGSGR